MGFVLLKSDVFIDFRRRSLEHLLQHAAAFEKMLLSIFGDCCCSLFRSRVSENFQL